MVNLESISNPSIIFTGKTGNHSTPDEKKGSPRPATIQTGRQSKLSQQRPRSSNKTPTPLVKKSPLRKTWENSTKSSQKKANKWGKGITE